MKISLQNSLGKRGSARTEIFRDKWAGVEPSLRGFLARFHGRKAFAICAPEPERRRSADWQSAVSRIGNPRASLIATACRLPVGETAGCQPALRGRFLGKKLVSRTRRLARAFTLMEVMIAISLFCIAIFAILDLTSRSLRAARGLQHTLVDAGSLAAELSLTNKLEEGSQSGDFGDRYPNCTWKRTITLMSTNGLFQVDFFVSQAIESRVVKSQMSILLYRPDSTVGVGSGNTLGTRNR